VIASENLRKPEIIMALGQHSDLFESVIEGTARDWGQSEKPREREIALDAAKYGTLIKFTVRLSKSLRLLSTGITLNIDLSSALSE
jgi:hypothetical protein